MKSDASHWDNIFAKTENNKLGWYEENTNQTIQLLNRIPNWEASTILITGAGTSALIDDLLQKKVKLILNDISIEAISLVKNRIGKIANEITWICQDIAQPLPVEMPNVDIWLDRAVLHFLTDESDIIGYFNNVKTLLRMGGYALFAEFSHKGALKCAGIPVHQYNVEELSDRLGESFELVTDFEWVFTNPKGEPRPYIYALYKRK
jgi:hypothetical protein